MEGPSIGCIADPNASRPPHPSSPSDSRPSQSKNQRPCQSPLSPARCKPTPPHLLPPWPRTLPATSAFLLFLKPARHAPAPGLLHWLFTLPGKFFLHTPTWFTPWTPSSPHSSCCLNEAYLGHLVSETHALPLWYFTAITTFYPTLLFILPHSIMGHLLPHNKYCTYLLWFAVDVCLSLGHRLQQGRGLPSSL